MTVRTSRTWISLFPIPTPTELPTRHSAGGRRATVRVLNTNRRNLIPTVSHVPRWRLVAASKRARYSVESGRLDGSLLPCPEIRIPIHISMGHEVATYDPLLVSVEELRAEIASIEAEIPIDAHSE